jgi:hypothetical protein
MSIGKTMDQKVSGSNPLGRATFDGRILAPTPSLQNFAKISGEVCFNNPSKSKRNVTR